MSKPLPKLSPAQAEAWGRVLVWFKESKHLFDEFYAGGYSNFAIKTMRWNGIEGTEPTFNALVRKGVLVARIKRFGVQYYAIHPDYLPQEDAQS